MLIYTKNIHLKIQPYIFNSIQAKRISPIVLQVMWRTDVPMLIIEKLRLKNEL